MNTADGIYKKIHWIVYLKACSHIWKSKFEKILKKKNFQKKDYEYKMCKEPSQYMPKMRNNTADCISKKKH